MITFARVYGGEMKSRFFLMGIGAVLSASLAQASAVARKASSFYFQIGGSVRWSHANLRLTTKAVGSWKAGFAAAAHGFGSRQQGVNGDMDYWLPDSDIMWMLTAPRATLDRDTNEFWRDRAGGGHNQPNPADAPEGPHHSAFYAQVQNKFIEFMRSLQTPDQTFSYIDINGVLVIGDAQHDQNIDTDALVAEWVFGKNAQGEAKDGVISLNGERSVEATSVQDIAMDRPVLDLTLKFSFALHPVLSIFLEGGYAFVFGKPVEKDNIDYDVLPQANEELSTVLNEKLLIEGGLAMRGFLAHSNKLMTAMKTSTSMKEGWKAFAGFEYMPHPALFVSVGVGLKEYKITVDCERKNVLFPYSPWFMKNAGLAIDKFVLDVSKKKMHFHRNIHPLAFKVSFGTVFAKMHVFSVGVEYVSTKADLYASGGTSSQKSNTSTASSESETVFTETFDNPYDPVAEYDTNAAIDFDSPLNIKAILDGGLPSVHMTAADQLSVKHSAQVDLTDISVSLNYQLRV